MKTFDLLKIVSAVAIYLFVLFVAKLVLWPLMSNFILRAMSSFGAGLDGLAISLGIFGCIVVASIASAAFLTRKSGSRPVYNAAAVGFIVLVYKLVQPDLTRSYDPYPFILAILSYVSIVVITVIIKQMLKSA